VGCCSPLRVGGTGFHNTPPRISLQKLRSKPVLGRHCFEPRPGYRPSSLSIIATLCWTLLCCHFQVVVCRVYKLFHLRQRQCATQCS
jgi:hypothetical protein